ncbi:Pappalysin-1 [Holothuria leucospilota]|uniref:Pappalysin-1 n=1 Tax=Holothuria leucospilota TaxID=206669 RepID=A0A9Q1C7D8_HOLLE|nr:Pappalysin-1 [Holothuria leucospilota]
MGILPDPPLILKARLILLFFLAMFCEYRVNSSYLDGSFPSASSIHPSQFYKGTVAENAGEKYNFKKCLTSSKRHYVNVERNPFDRLEKKSRKRRRRNVLPRKPEQEDGITNAAYFDLDTDLLYYRNLLDDERFLPSGKFSFEIWVKPEGGQAPDAVIAELSDKCKDAGEWGWAVGISALNLREGSDARYFFRIKTDRSIQPTVIRAQHTYRENRWVHIIVTYDGYYQRMYINGALVAKGKGQRGPIFSPVTMACKQFTIGGSAIDVSSQFRGTIHKLALSSMVSSHEQVKLAFRREIDFALMENTTIYEDFADLNEWEVFGKNQPFLNTITIPSEFDDLKIDVPPCGMTVCDNVDLITRYNRVPLLRQMKALKYRYIVTAEDDGTNPLVSPSEVNRQHLLVVDAFRIHNISWTFQLHVVRNSILRRKRVMVSCTEDQIGDGHCDNECNYKILGFDGGDCINFDDPIVDECYPEQIGDSICHDACNFARFYYDGGDCCNVERTDTAHCRDPSSRERAYISLNLYKETVGLDSKTHLNVHLVTLVEGGVMGLAAYPWYSEALTIYGGTVIDTDSLKHNNTLIHELGHNLGLWHTHHGITELSCSDKCRETYPSLNLGDLVQDTNPTPENTRCHDPVYGEYRVCDFDRPTFKDTPFRNYMGFGDDSCASEFTNQQAARMHCYIDLTYSSWRDTSSQELKPILPFPPTIVRRAETGRHNEVTLRWLPPFGAHSRGMCSSCLENGALKLYASSAYYFVESHRIDDMALHATGPPDAERCRRDKRGWYPRSAHKHNCQRHGCFLEMRFDHAIPVTTISIWVNYAPRESITDVELLLTNGSVTSLGSIYVSCDVPYTRTLNIEVPVSRIRLYVTRPYISVDSVQLESFPAQEHCYGCNASYVLSRVPHFENGEIQVLEDRQFTDRTIEDDVTYSYSVRALTDVILGPDFKLGHPTPPSEYFVGKAFCGDGSLDTGEDCDDGNLAGGDGCNMQCQEEDFFRCEGEPSVCRYFRGDGECESFEVYFDSWQDCGFFTPEGYVDQWATKAEITEHNTTRCDPLKLVGPSPPQKFCRIFYDITFFESELPVSLHDSWSPCSNDFFIDWLDRGWFEVQVSFDRPVVATTVIVHLAAVVDFKDNPVRITVRLLDPRGRIHAEPASWLVLSCHDNPIHINVYHDLSNSFHYTKYVRLLFNQPYVAVSGVRLRESTILNPIALTSCGTGDLYNPATQQCGNYTQQIPKCERITRNVIRNANTTCEGFLEGDECHVECHEGYRPSGGMKLTCKDNRWYNIDETVCKPVVCADPQIENAVMSCPGGKTYRKRCSFKCVPPAKLKGDQDSNVIFCQEDGLFSLPDASCQMTCDTPSIPNHSVLLSKQCIHVGQVVGTMCKFRCDAGYAAYNVERTGYSNIFHHTCSKGLSWVGPSCRRITCPSIPPEVYGDYNCTDGFFYNSRCSKICPTGNTEEQVMTCLKSGEWTGDLRTCQGDEFWWTCQPPISVNGDIRYDCWNSWKLGFHCDVRCEDPSHIPMLLSTDGARRVEWSDFRLRCDARSKQWYPEATNVIC